MLFENVVCQNGWGGVGGWWVGVVVVGGGGVGGWVWGWGLSKVLSACWIHGVKYVVMQYALRLYSPKMHLCGNLNITFHFLFLVH